MNNLRPWFSNDIAAILKSILFATKENESQEYQRGFLACVIAICFAVGIQLKDVNVKHE